MAQSHGKNWAERVVAELQVPLTDDARNEAVTNARAVADLTGLPQTVYRDKDSSGWTCTNAFADRLRDAEKTMTALPQRYFVK